MGEATLDLIKLYEITTKEEHDFLAAHQTRVKFYTSIVTAIFAGTVAGAFKATLWYHYIFLCVGPLLTLTVSSIAIEGTFRLYRRFLLTVIMRAKLEQRMGMTQSLKPNENDYWQGEPLIPRDFLRNRSSFDSSEEFFAHFQKRGYHLATRKLFYGFQLLGAVLLVGLVALAWMNL